MSCENSISILIKIPFATRGQLCYSYAVNVVLYFQSPSKTSTPEKLAGVKEIASSSGWHVQIIEDLPTAQSVHALVRFWKPIGAIVECGGSLQEIDPRPFSGLPVVFLDRNPTTLSRSLPCVYHDSRETAALAARELMTTGYRHFAYIHAPESRFWSVERERGFREALRLNGIEPSVMPPVGSKSTIILQRKLRAFIRTLAKPCAIFAANDLMAGEVLSAVAALELSVPDDIAVLGVDNYADICESTRPTLSSIEPDFRGGGRQAALLLQELCRSSHGRSAPGHQTFGPLRVVRRASTRILKAHDREVEAALLRIRNEACNGLTAAQVLSAFSCSRGRAEIRFRAVTGHSILEEIHAVRLARAQDLLSRPHLQLKVLHAFCGFKTPCALQKFFLKETGMTLGTWRKNRRPS